MINVKIFFDETYQENKRFPYWKKALHEAFLDHLSYLDKKGQSHPVFKLDMENKQLLMENNPEALYSLENYMMKYLDKMGEHPIKKTVLHHFFEKKLEERRIQKVRREFAKELAQELPLYNPKEMISFDEFFKHYYASQSDRIRLIREYYHFRHSLSVDGKPCKQIIEKVNHKGHAVYAFYKKALPALLKWHTWEIQKLPELTSEKNVITANELAKQWHVPLKKMSHFISAQHECVFYRIHGNKEREAGWIQRFGSPKGIVWGVYKNPTFLKELKKRFFLPWNQSFLTKEWKESIIRF